MEYFFQWNTCHSLRIKVEGKMMPDQKKDCWDIVSIIAQLLIPVVLGVGTWTLNKTLQQNELRAKNLEIAVSILRAEPNDKTRAIREWALKVFLDYSAVKPSEKAIEELQLSILPSFVFDRDENGDLEFDADGNPNLDSRAKQYFDSIEKK
jgi:hypothetical protein